MDFNDKKVLVDGIFYTLDENQALIEVVNELEVAVSST